ncbi:hypothetical protein [Flavobacterium sp. LMO8]|uniref:hypothetical protein n=1 Tax=Flavobacterium sp. LMO8 TaxID=2654244 RepID=UPI00351AFF3C
MQNFWIKNKSVSTNNDQLGTSHTLEKQPVRIVSLVPSQTELLYDLGLEDNIVRITKFCVYQTQNVNG